MKSHGWAVLGIPVLFLFLWALAQTGEKPSDREASPGAKLLAVF